MVFKRKAMVLALLAMYVECGTAFANSPLQQKLLEQAQFWEQRGREDNAADAWDKLLKLDPDNTDAMTALGLRAARTGNTDLAKNYLTKLRDNKASAGQIRSVEEAIRRGTNSGRSQLDDARKLAQQGDMDAAAESYRLLGDPSRMKGDAALEYYQVLAGTLSGYKDAKLGLAKLVKDNPGNTRYALAYAQVLTYRDATRAEGIALLDNLSSKPEVAKQANDAWRQALSWMGVQNNNAKYFRTYLDKHPGDKTIEDKLAAVSRQVREVQEAKPAVIKPKPESPFIKAQSAGFKALDENDVPAAEKEFQSLIKSHPKDPVGYGGMGLVKMRGEEFTEARKYLQKALNLSSERTKKNWKQAYDDANYWAIVEEARTAFEDADSQKGIALLRKAIELNPKEVSGILQLADALQAENDLPGAEQNFRRVFDQDKTNMRALDGLIGVYALQKKLADLEALSQFMLPRQLAIVANVKSEALSEQAKRAEAAGDFDGAQRALEDAIMLKPDDAWLRMGLAKLYLKRDMPGQARALLDALTEVEKPDPEALYVSALLSQMQQLWWEGLMTLERVPANSRKAEMFTLQKRLWIRVQLDRIDILNRRGQTDQVKSILASIEAAVGNDPEFIGTIASLYIKLGDNERGYAMIRQAVQATAQPSASLLLQYASTLMQENQEAELEAVMRKVAAMPNLQEDEVKSFKQLQKALAMRYSERAREAGDFANSYTYIQPLLIAQPEDNLLLLTLARIYASAGDTDPAKEIYEKVLETEPENPEILQGLVFAAIQIKDFPGAEKYLNQLMRLQPDNPRFIALAGNVARAQGQNGKALGYFKKALAMEQAQRPLAGRGVNGLRLVDQTPTGANLTNFNVNPFADRKTEATVRNVPAPVLKQVPQLGPQYSSPAARPIPGLSSGAPATATATGAANSAAVVPAANVVATPVLPATISAPVKPVSVPSNNAPALPTSSAYRQNTVAGYGGAGSGTGSSAVAGNSTANPVSVQSVAIAGNNADTYSPPVPATVTTSSRKSSQAQVSPEETALMKEIDSLNELNRSEVVVGLAGRARSGQAGLSQLTDTELPIEARLSTLGYGQFGLKIIPVMIDGGTLNLNDSTVAGQFGKNAIVNQQAIYAKVPFSAAAAGMGLSSAPSLDQVAKGVALSLSYELGGLKADLGSSPLNFPIQNVVGGLRWSGQSDGFNFSAELSRRSVTDSYLSYAGAKDTLYGLSWGGVTKNGLHLDLSYDMDDGGFYAGTGFYALNGKNVEKNTSIDAGAGAYWRAYRTKDTTITAGVGLTSMFYKKNLSFFTYGHGGYFSPQSFVALNFPVEITGRNGRLSYQAGAAIGVQHFRTDDAPYYPLISSDQAALELFAAANPTVNVPTTYAGQSHTGVQYKLSGALEYLLSPHFSVGGRLSVDNSGDFTDASGLIYLRYTFEPKRGPVSFPPIAPKPYYSGN